MKLAKLSVLRKRGLSGAILLRDLCYLTIISKGES